MLKLLIKNTTVTDSQAAVSWSLDQDDLDRLSDRFGPHACDGYGFYLLLITVPKGQTEECGLQIRKETRKIVPLTDPYAYVEFKYPGKNLVFAAVIFGRKVELCDRWLGGGGRGGRCGYNYPVLSETEEGPLAFGFKYNCAGYASITAALDVEVPEECFPKEPPEWEKAWVNWMYCGEAFDQCEYRQRRLMAYSIQPPIFAVRYLFGALATLALMLVGMRGIACGFLLHPLRRDVADIWYRLRGSIFLPRAKDDIKDFLWKLLLVPLTPLFWVTAGLIFVGLGSLPQCDILHRYAATERFWIGSGAFLAVYYWGLLCISCSVILYLLGMSFIGWLGKLENRTKADTGSRDQPATRRPTEPKPAILSEKDAANLASGAPRPLSLRELPPERRTVRLRFQELKAKVCRPYRGR